MPSLGLAALVLATRIELYTMGSGDDLFSKYGHAALCANDVCYNYGTADFSRPIGLGWEVIRGRARFWVSVSNRESMIQSFASEDRTIYRQKLPLEEAKAAALAAALERDAAPENRLYLYNHFLENCSTRPRDHIDDATGGALRRVRLPVVGTYRDYANEGLSRQSLLLVPATNLILGRWVDRRIDAYAAMFIPDVLREGVDSAFGATPEVVYERVGPELPPRVKEAGALSWAGVIVVVLAFGASSFLGPKARRVFRRLGGALLGALGALLLFAALVSVLPELRRNELLLVFFPLDFFLISRNLAFVSSYSTMRLSVLALVAALRMLGVLIQPLWPFWFFSVGIVAAILVSARRAYTTRP